MTTAIATPCYGGNLDSQYLKGLIGAFTDGHVQHWLTIATESLVPRARNRIAYQFLETEADTLIMIDADIGFMPRDIERILSHNLPIVGGCYPKKVDGPSAGYVYNFPTGEEKGDLIAVEETGTGFLCIQRATLDGIIADMLKRQAILEGLLAQHKVTVDPFMRNFRINVDDKYSYCDLFPTGAFWPDERYLSEDWGFCYLARQAGYTIWLDRGIRLQHAGRKVYQ